MADYNKDSLMEMFNFEMAQLVQQLEQVLLECDNGYTMDRINDVFRVMHTIKGSAAMMNFKSIVDVAHTVEDLFFYLREENPKDIDEKSLTDNVLEGVDFIKEQLDKIIAEDNNFDDPKPLADKLTAYVATVKGVKPADATASAGTSAPKVSAASVIGGANHYWARIAFTKECEMENVRVYAMLNNNKAHIDNVTHNIPNLMDTSSIDIIKTDGFEFRFTSNHDVETLRKILNETIYLDTLEIKQIGGGTAASGGEQNVYNAVLIFESDSEMENVRAYTVVHNLKNHAQSIEHTPVDLIDEAASVYIRKNGFKLKFASDKTFSEIHNLLSDTLFLKEVSLEQVSGGSETAEQSAAPVIPAFAEPAAAPANTAQAAPVPPPESNIGNMGGMNMATTNVSPVVNPSVNADEQNETNMETAAMDAAAESASRASAKTTAPAVISVNVSKLDHLFKAVGELVIAEAMVTENPELENLELDGFHKEARHLRKIIKDLQDTVMSMRMVPLSQTFFRMNRIVRDMCRSLNKEVQLDIVGDATEVDKSITERIYEPLLHIMRNAIDHGIETPQERVAKGKPAKGTVLLEAKNSGSDVLIIVKDDGAGLNKEKILAKAKQNGLLRKAENEYTDKEIYQFINMPGFSTNENVTSYSGRGVGMNVVTQNLEPIGGTVIVDSVPGEGTTFTLKIPLTLAIVEGMLIRLAGEKYTIPIANIKTSFRPELKDIFVDPTGNEMITVRENVYNIVRLHEFFGIQGCVTDFESGILMIVENGSESVCLFLDELIGESQVVVKSLPKYIGKVNGISGCTLLGNGDISLIIDVAGFFDK